jgi:hypothetical protein
LDSQSKKEVVFDLFILIAHPPPSQYYTYNPRTLEECEFQGQLELQTLFQKTNKQNQTKLKQKE